MDKQNDMRPDGVGMFLLGVLLLLMIVTYVSIVIQGKDNNRTKVKIKAIEYLINADDQQSAIDNLIQMGITHEQ